MVKISNTRNLFTELIKASLVTSGYTITPKKDFFVATKGEEKLSILLVTRTLPNTETTTVQADKSKVSEFIRKTERLKGKVTPCLAFGVGKYENNNLIELETLVVPVDTIEKFAPTQEKTGKMFSRASGHYHYNYEKYEKTDTSYELIRHQWKLK